MNPYALRRRNLKPEEDEGNCAIAEDCTPSGNASARNDAPCDGSPPSATAPSGPDFVETALARALADASAAGRFDVVVQILKELEARRTAREAQFGQAEDARRPPSSPAPQLSDGVASTGTPRNS